MTTPVLSLKNAMLSLNGNSGRVDILHGISLKIRSQFFLLLKLKKLLGQQKFQEFWQTVMRLEPKLLMILVKNI